MNHSKTIMNLIGLRVSMSSLFTEGNYDDTKTIFLRLLVTVLFPLLLLFLYYEW